MFNNVGHLRDGDDDTDDDCEDGFLEHDGQFDPDLSGCSSGSGNGLQRCSAAGAGMMIKKSLLWQQRDRLFSRWKERYFVLTKDYLQCYKKGSSRISEMGGFIFKIKLSEVIT